MLAVNGKIGDVPVPSQSLNQNSTRTTDVGAARAHRDALPLQKLWISLRRSCRRNMGQWAIVLCVRSTLQVGCRRTPACGVRRTTFARTMGPSIRRSACTTIGGLFPRSRHIGTLSLCSSRTDSSCPDWGSNFEGLCVTSWDAARAFSAVVPLMTLLCSNKVRKYSGLPSTGQPISGVSHATLALVPH